MRSAISPSVSIIASRASITQAAADNSGGGGNGSDPSCEKTGKPHGVPRCREKKRGGRAGRGTNGAVVLTMTALLVGFPSSCADQITFTAPEFVAQLLVTGMPGIRRIAFGPGGDFGSDLFVIGSSTGEASAVASGGGTDWVD